MNAFRLPSRKVSFMQIPPLVDNHVHGCAPGAGGSEGKRWVIPQSECGTFFQMHKSMIKCPQDGYLVFVKAF